MSSKYAKNIIIPKGNAKINPITSVMVSLNTGIKISEKINTIMATDKVINKANLHPRNHFECFILFNKELCFSMVSIEIIVFHV